MEPVLDLCAIGWLTAYQQAVGSGQTAVADQTAADITAISNSASQFAAQHELNNPDWWSRIGMLVLALVFLALAYFTYLYGTNVGFSRLTTIEGTRPLLVIAAITSTIAFGGALLLGSLFSSEGEFEDRFRHAREIFLVFSGIFGTVIGFYFGASDSKGPQLSVSATLEGNPINLTPPTSPIWQRKPYGAWAWKAEAGIAGA